MSWSYADINLYNLAINGEKFQSVGLDLVTRADFELTIDGASNIVLEFHDTNLTLLKSGILSRTIRLHADDDFYDLVSVAKNGKDITCTFEAMAVVALREKREPRKAAAGTVTRAAFVKMLVSEIPWIKFVLPLNIQLPVALEELTRGDMTTSTQTVDTSTDGLGTFDVAPIDPAIGAGLGGLDQLGLGGDDGNDLIDPNDPGNTATADDGSDGSDILQIDTVTGAPKKLSKKKRQIAADPTLAENTWDASGRITQQVNDLRFVRKLEFWYVTYAWMMLQTPVATFSEYTEGVDTIDFDFDIGKPLATATIACRAHAWDVPPGKLVTLKGVGPAIGNWIVKTVSGNFFNNDLTVELIQPLPRLDEPEGTASTVSQSTDGLPPLVEGPDPGAISAGLGQIGDIGPPDLVKIGQGSHQLRVDAAASFKRVETRLGRQVFVTDSYRTYAQQADLYKRKPGLAARPGTSGHEKGICVDIVEMTNLDIKAAFEANDWHQFNRKKEPWHWSYHVTT